MYDLDLNLKGHVKVSKLVLALSWLKHLAKRTNIIAPILCWSQINASVTLHWPLKVTSYRRIITIINGRRDTKCTKFESNAIKSFGDRSQTRTEGCGGRVVTKTKVSHENSVSVDTIIEKIRKICSKWGLLTYEHDSYKCNFKMKINLAYSSFKPPSLLSPTKWTT